MHDVHTDIMQHNYTWQYP